MLNMLNSNWLLKLGIALSIFSNINAMFLGQQQYLGCYSDYDPSNPQLTGHHVIIEDLTPQKCADVCYLKGYDYIGLHNHNECYCGNEITNQGAINYLGCICGPCAGSGTASCGCSDYTRILKLKTMFDPCSICGENTDCSLGNDVTECHCYTGFIGDPYQGCCDPKKCDCFTSVTQCSPNANCSVVNDQPQCTCNNGFEGDGFNCNLVTTTLPDLPNPCDEPGVCGYGATCTPDGTNAVCSCPTGSMGDPTLNCCDREIKCNCWGDPHCRTFDRSKFEFQGMCKYDLVSTTCHGSDLPDGMTHFDVRQKHTNRGSTAPVSWVEYIELNAFGNEYRLLPGRNFTKNGLNRPYPYMDSNNVKVYLKGIYLVLATDFGLTITFDGVERTQVYLCSAYSGYICGLCGNGDGDRSRANEYVDRDNNPVSVTGHPLWRYLEWGKKWKIDTDTQQYDQDGSECNETPVVESPEDCKNQTIYENSQDWCGLINNTSGPWAQCLQEFNPEMLGEFIENCGFDLCMNENDTVLLQSLICKVYEEFTGDCLALSQELNVTWIFNWRDATDCKQPCPENQEWKVISECPKTCEYASGDYDCGNSYLTEGCYCKDGYVAGPNGACILQEECGCLAPDNTTTIQVGSHIISEDCSKIYNCTSPQSPPIVTDLTPCSSNGFCKVVNNTPTCECKNDYEGDGYTCTPLTCEAEYCYAFGDPHYRSMYGSFFTVNNTCSFVLASDNCNGIPSRKITIDHEIYNTYTGNSYMKSIRIKYPGSYYKIDTDFWINGNQVTLPYNFGSLKVYRQDPYIVFEDQPRLILHFDGNILLKLKVCKPFDECGLCKLQHNDNDSLRDQLEQSCDEF